MSKTPSEIIDLMMDHDGFSRWLHIERVEEQVGFVKLKLTIQEDMLNGFGIAHGGIAYSLADSALAFASNSHGRKAVSIETSISHLKKVQQGDCLYAITKEINRTHKIGIYHIDIVNQMDTCVAVFKGTVYFSSEMW